MRSRGYGLIEVILAALILSLISSFAVRGLIQNIKTTKYTQTRLKDVVTCKNMLEKLRSIKFDDLSAIRAPGISIEHINSDLIKIEVMNGKAILVTLRSRY